MSRLLGGRGLRWLLVTLVGLGAILLFLLATATANTDLFAGRYDLLLIGNGVLVTLLMLLVGYQLLRLVRSLRRGVFGSRLALRLVLLFALVAVLPGALVYAVSVQFLGKSIESWFDVRVDRALDGGLNLGRNALDYLQREAGNKAGQIAATLGEPGAGSVVSRLNRAAEQAGVYEAALFSTTGAVLAVAGIGGSTGHAGAAPGAGAAAGAAAADVHGDRAARRRRPGAARRRPRQQRRPARAAQAAAGRRAGAEGARAGDGKGADGRARLPGDLVHARRAQAPLPTDADADAAARTDFGAGSRGAVVRTFRRTLGRARGRHPGGGAGRLHAPHGRSRRATSSGC